MTDYENETLGLIPGETPRKKYESMVSIIKILTMIAYPKDGTYYSREELAEIIKKIISYPK